MLLAQLELDGEGFLAGPQHRLGVGEQLGLADAYVEEHRAHLLLGQLQLHLHHHQRLRLQPSSRLLNQAHPCAWLIL